MDAADLIELVVGSEYGVSFDAHGELHSFGVHASGARSLHITRDERVFYCYRHERRRLSFRARPPVRAPGVRVSGSGTRTKADEGRTLASALAQ